MVAQKASSPGDRARRFMTVATNTLASGAGRVRWCTLNDTEHSLLPSTVLFDGEEVEAPRLAVGDCRPENFSVSYFRPVASPSLEYRVSPSSKGLSVFTHRRPYVYSFPLFQAKVGCGMKLLSDDVYRGMYYKQLVDVLRFFPRVRCSKHPVLRWGRVALAL